MATLEERIAALEARVAELAATLAEMTTSPVAPATGVTDPTAGSRSAPSTTEVTDRDGIFWALEGLRRRLPDPAGAVLYTGIVEPVPGERYEWQYGAGTAELMEESEWSAPAAALAALGHPVRLLLLREVLAGRRTAADLSEVEGLGTSGQLYHHLRHLTAAGWLRSAGRGQYAIPPERVVPLLVILTAARH